MCQALCLILDIKDTESFPRFFRAISSTDVEDLWDCSAIDSLASDHKEMLEGQNVRKAEAGFQRYSLT